ARGRGARSRDRPPHAARLPLPGLVGGRAAAARAPRGDRARAHPHALIRGGGRGLARALLPFPAMIPHRLRVLYRHSFREPRRERLFLASVSFFFAFGVT